MLRWHRQEITSIFFNFNSVFRAFYAILLYTSVNSDLNAKKCEFKMEKSYDSLVVWRIRKIPPPDKEPRETYDQRIKEWVLSSMGMDEKDQAIYSLIESSNMATMEEIMENLVLDEEQVMDGLDQLHSAGLIEKLGRAYYIKDKLSKSIVSKLLPRINESLRLIASVESSSRNIHDPMLKLGGKSYKRVKDAIAACKYLTREGLTVMGRVIGVQAYSKELVEFEGPVLEYGSGSMTLLTETGEKVNVGDGPTKGVDVRAHTVIIRGARNE